MSDRNISTEQQFDIAWLRDVHTRATERAALNAVRRARGAVSRQVCIEPEELLELVKLAERGLGGPDRRDDELLRLRKQMGEIAVLLLQNDRDEVMEWARGVKLHFPDGAPELVADSKEKPCTCHPDDNPPRPCPRKYALSECRRAHEELA